MKKTVWVGIFIAYSGGLFCQELPEKLFENMVGYWRNSLDKNKVLVFEKDSSYQLFNGGKRAEYGTISFELQSMYKVKFNSSIGDCSEFRYSNNYIWKVPAHELQFGDSPVDGGDFIFYRMKEHAVYDFLGGKQILRALKQKSDKGLARCLSDWQMMSLSPDCPWSPSRALLSIYQVEAAALFNDFYMERLENNNSPCYYIIYCGLGFVGQTNFDLTPSKTIDSMANVESHMADLKAEINDDEKYENFLKQNIYGPYIEEVVNVDSIKFHKLVNFNPWAKPIGDAIFLPLNSSKFRAIGSSLGKHYKKYWKWLIGRKHLRPVDHVKYDVFEWPWIEEIIFNQKLDLAIVGYSEPYESCRALYGKQNGKWIHLAFISCLIE